MLVALIRTEWEKSKQDTIKNKTKALAAAQSQRVGRRKDIDSLQQGEDLWLYSHGSSTTFAGLTSAELVGWLLKKANMPPGARRLVLKGCKTAGYAAEVQDIIQAQTGFEKVVVLGFEGEASQTTASGEMLVRRGGEKEKAAAARQGALAEIRARRDLEGSVLDKAARDERVRAEREKVERESRTFTAVLDDGRSTYVAKDDRMTRRLERESAKEVDRDEEPEEAPVVRTPRKKKRIVVDSDDDTDPVKPKDGTQDEMDVDN